MTGVTEVFRRACVLQPPAENRMSENRAYGIRESACGLAPSLRFRTADFGCCRKPRWSEPVHPLLNAQQQSRRYETSRRSAFFGATTVNFLAELVNVWMLSLIPAQAPREAISFPRRDKQVFRRERLFQFARRAVERSKQHLLSQTGTA